METVDTFVFIYIDDLISSVYRFLEAACEFQCQLHFQKTVLFGSFLPVYTLPLLD
jgi:hypothetical protein